MLRKIVMGGAIFAIALGLTGCFSSTDEGTTTETPPTTTEQGTEATGFELALVTDVGTIDDKSFNQGSWEGLKAYADENGISHKYYQPAEKSVSSLLETIGLAVQGGAKLVVTPGFLFEEAVYQAQSMYPEVKFVFIDGAPHAGDFVPNIGDNVKSIFYAEEQAGFLAGYAAVMDGNRKLGFMGGLAVPAVIRFGYGFVQGAEYAGKELGLAEGDISIKYTYVGNFDATPENQTLASSWYQSGTELIFACGGGVGNSVMAAAEPLNRKVIGVDVDQHGESISVITSAVKLLQASVYDSLAEFYAGTFEGGKSVVLGVTDDMVGLPMETSKFESFTQENYDDIYAKLKSDENGIRTAILNDTGAETADKLPTEKVTVEVLG